MKLVLGMVRNAVSTDFRVMKTARGAAEAGYESVVLGRQSAGATPSERIDGVAIRRIARGAESEVVEAHADRIPWDEIDKASVADTVFSGPDGVKDLERYRSALVRKREQSGGAGEKWNVFRRRVARKVSGSVRRVGRFAWKAMRRIYRAPKHTLKRVPGVRSCVSIGRRLLGPSRDDIVAKCRHTLKRVPGVRSCVSLGRRLLRPSRDEEIEKCSITYSTIEGFWEFYPEALKIRPDLIHAHELSSLLPAIAVGRRTGVPVVYDSHELEFARNSPWSKETFAFWRRHERQLIAEASAVIAVSEGCAEALKREYGISDVVIVRNCPSCVRKPPAMDLRSFIGVSSEVPLLVFVGKVTFNRGLDMMVDVLEHLGEYHLACVGPEDARYRGKIEATANQRGVGERIHFVPAVPPEQLIEFISSADVSVVAVRDVCLSYRYCLPNKLFESAHAGLPIVASNLPDMRSFIEKWGIGEIVPEENAESWKEAIELVYRKRGEYYSGEKLERLRAENSAESEIAKVIALYERLLA